MQFEKFLFHVPGDMRARPRYADADSANLQAISADRKQKSFEMEKKIHMQNSSLLTSEIPDLEQFKAWYLYRVSQSELLNACKIVIAYVRRLQFCMWIFFTISKLLYLMSSEIACKLAETASAYRGRAHISPLSCLSAALKRQPNEAGNKYSELYTYFRLAKKISPRYLQK